MLMLLLLQTVVLVAACSKSNDAYAEQEQQPTVLTIYVYAPEKAVATRSDMGDVDATSAESRVNSLQIWVFEHEDATLVGYLSPTVSLLNSEQAEAYLLDVSALFAEMHPNVDVYVLANAAGMGLGAGSTRSALEDAVMSGDNFGISQPTTAVPPGGMPMSGVLRDQPVCGDNPVLRIGSATEMATVRLKRMVSKLRFVFTCSKESTERVSIDGITLDANTIPTEEYLFLDDDGKNYHIGNTYVTTAATLSTGIATLASCTAPLEYVYTAGTEAQDYEELISGGVTAGDLSQAGPYYLRYRSGEVLSDH